MFTNNYGNEILYVKLKTFELNMAQSGKYKGMKASRIRKNMSNFIELRMRAV